MGCEWLDQNWSSTFQEPFLEEEALSYGCDVEEWVAGRRFRAADSERCGLNSD